MGGLFLILLAAPVVIAVVGFLIVRPVSSGQGLAAVASALLLSGAGMWLGLRYDESAVEAVVAAALCGLATFGLVVARRSARAARFATASQQIWATPSGCGRG